MSHPVNRVNSAGEKALQSEDLIAEVMDSFIEQSKVMQVGSRLRDMRNDEIEMRVIDELPYAYFVGENTLGGTEMSDSGVVPDNQDTSYKRLTQMAWARKTVKAAELAVILPMSENVLDDTDDDMIAKIIPRIAEAFAVKFDHSVLFGGEAGTRIPSFWPKPILRQCWSNSTALIYDPSTPMDIGDGDTLANPDILDYFIQHYGLMNLVEESGYDVTGYLAGVDLKSRIRSLRTTTDKERLTDADFNVTSVEGAPITYLRSDAWLSDPAGVGLNPGQRGGAMCIGGDMSQVKYAFRKSLSYRVLREATLEDPDNPGTVLYNLAQQDMIALRFVMRLGWQIPNPINRLKKTVHDGGAGQDPIGQNRFPFSALVRPADT